MPRINDQVNTYPKGYFLAKSATTIPDDAQFVIAQAADGYKGVIGDPGSYVYDTWSGQVDMAYQAGVKMGAQLTLRIAGNDFPIDFINPDADRQLQGFLAALKNRTYEFIVLRIVSADSDVAEVKAASFFGQQLRDRTGKRVFLQVNEAMWKNSQHWDIELGQESAPWSLLIIGDYETAVGAAIETPGMWNTSKNMIWEQRPGIYRDWPPYAADYSSQPPDPPDPGDPPDPPDPGDPPVSSDELVQQIYGLRQDLRHIFEGLPPL